MFEHVLFRTRLAATAVAAILLGTVLVHGAAPDAKSVLDQTDARRMAMLEEMLRRPYPESGAWRHEDFALAAYTLNRKCKEADEAILAVQRQNAAGSIKSNDFHWHAYLLQRLYFLFSRNSRHFPGRMGPEAEQAVVDMLWAWAAPACRREMTLPERDWWVWGSENHHAQAWAGFWGAAQIFAARDDCRARRYADGSTPAEMALAFNDYFKRFARARAGAGLLVECNSAYNKYTLGGWYNMADFADDPVLRRRMGMLLELFWTDWAVEQIDGIRGGSRHRCYPGENSTSGSGADGMSWFHFGLGKPRSKHPSSMCAATTFWRPPVELIELARNPAARGAYAYVSRRPGLAEQEPLDKPANYTSDKSHPFFEKHGVYRLAPAGGGLTRYTYCTPDFVLGTSMVEARPTTDWTNISSQNRWEGVIFGGHPTARIFVQPLKPARGSVYNAFWSVQSKGTLIVQRLKTSNAKAMRVWFDRALTRTEEAGWVFAEAPRAYAAVRVVEGGTRWEPDTVEQHHEGKGRTDQGDWLRCVDEFSPVVIEVARKADFADLAAFRRAILANPLTWRKPALSYESRHDKTRLELWTDYSRPPRVDGKPIDYQAGKVYDCPFFHADFGSGRITIEYPSGRRELDFTSERP